MIGVWDPKDGYFPSHFVFFGRDDMIELGPEREWSSLLPQRSCVVIERGQVE